MSTPGWTPGPWMATQNERSGHFLIEQCPASTNVALTFGGIPRHEEKANADLLAAAPELYEALEEFAEAMVGTRPELSERLFWKAILKRSHAALAKARGESQ